MIIYVPTKLWSLETPVDVVLDFTEADNFTIVTIVGVT